MRKIVSIAVLIVSMAILLAAMNQSFINKLKQDRYFDHLNAHNPHENSLYRRLLIRSDRWRYGDLYGLCYLPQYKLKLEPFKLYTPKGGRPVTNRILYIIGDSFLADKTLNGAFDGFDDVIFFDRRFAFGPIKPDSTKQNYLIMEFAERNLNDYGIQKTGEIKWTKKDLQAGLNFNAKFNTDQPGPKTPTSFFDRVNNIIFNKDLGRNLELLLFDDKIFTPVKELKASLNYKLTGRLAKEVAVSTDTNRLLLNITVDTSNRQSAFRELPANEIARLAGALNKDQDYYRSIGFKKVLLSVIPNAVSVYDAKRMNYNHLLERIERSNQFPVISIFNTYKADKCNLFYRSDAHWNPRGLDVWVTETNKALQANLNLH